MKQPPRLAAFLLQRLVPEHEPLRGDLLEGVHGGESSLWYWRQVIAAIFVGAIRTCRAHPFAVARGLAVGWIGMWILSRYVAPQIQGFDERLFVRGFRWFYTHGYRVPQVWPFAFLLIACSIAIGGNLAVRTSGVQGPAMAVIYAATILLWITVMFIYTLTTPPLAYGRYLFSSPEVWLLPIAALLGGLWGARGTKLGTATDSVD
jgi:hypothetical protein